MKLAIGSSASSSRWPAVAGAILFLFLASFYTPLSAKGTNNIFYAGIGLPALVWWFWQPRAATAVFAIAPRVFWLAAALVLWLTLRDISFLREGLYLLALYLACVLLERDRPRTEQAFAGFALVSVGMLLCATVLWLHANDVTGAWGRVELWGQTRNPVYAALLITSALVWGWMFAVDTRLHAAPAWALALALLVLTALCVLCAMIFQARSALLGFTLFLCGYIVQRRLALAGAITAVAAVAVLALSGLGQTLLERGLSFRLDIWADAVSRLLTDCNVLLGCGRDDYRFASEFFHPHSAYVSMFYHGGVVAALLLLAMLALLFVQAWRVQSRWLLVALVGWGGVLTATNGIITSPRPLWVFFWVPTLMALIDSGRPALAAYYSARGD
jgi:hypothetical protein